MSRTLNIAVNIGAKIGSTLNSTISGVERRFGRFSRQMRVEAAEVKAAWVGVDRAIGGIGKNARTFASHVSAPAAGLVALGVRAEYTWQQAGNALQAALDLGPAGSKARRQIEAIARSLPGDTTANLQAAVDLAKTGFDASAIVGSLRTTVLLAQSDPDSVDTRSASDILTNVLTSMRLPMKTAKQAAASASRVANLLAYGANKSSSDVRLMGESFKYSAPMATRLGLSVEDLTAIFMTMADAGIKGSESGVAMRSAMVRLMRLTPMARAVLARHNMDIRDYVKMSNAPTGGSIVRSLKAQGLAADGAQRTIQALLNNKALAGEELTSRITDAVVEGLGAAGSAMDRDLIADAVAGAMMAGASKVDLLKFMRDAQGKFTPADIANFFDARQGARLMTLVDGTLTGNLDDAHNRAGGFLDRAAKAQQQGLVGGWMRMQRSFGKLLGAVEGTGAFDTIAGGMDKIASGIDRLSKANPQLVKFVTLGLVGLASLAPLGFIATGLAAGFNVLRGSIMLLAGPIAWLPKLLLRGFIPALTTLGPWLLRGLAAAFGLLSNPVGWAILAASAAMLIYRYRDELGKAWTAVTTWFTTSAWPAIKDTGKALLNWGGQIVDGLIGGLKANWGRLTGWFGERWSGLTSFGGGAANDNSPVARQLASFSLPLRVDGARANGGSVSAGRVYRINEEGAEAFVPGRSGTVIPAHVLADLRAARSGGGPSFGSVTINVNGANDPQATAREVERVIRRMAGKQSGYLSD